MAFPHENKPASGPPAEGSPSRNLGPRYPLALTQEGGSQEAEAVLWAKLPEVGLPRGKVLLGFKCVRGAG